ncbi:hypothetical protein DEI82_02470 [Curtobacterium sp. MCBD17_019]|nr:hypothetical protein DEI82_02470 [Curtobacterium sp. MCBD17_019]
MRAMTDSNDAAQHPAVPLGSEGRHAAEPSGDAAAIDHDHTHDSGGHTNIGALGDDSVGHIFDQTNGLADGLSGDSEENEDLQGSESSTGDGRLTFDDTEGGGNVTDGGGYTAGDARDGEVTHP